MRPPCKICQVQVEEHWLSVYIPYTEKMLSCIPGTSITPRMVCVVVCSRINFWCSGANLVHCLGGRCTRFLSCYPSARHASSLDPRAESDFVSAGRPEREFTTSLLAALRYVQTGSYGSACVCILKIGGEIVDESWTWEFWYWMRL